MEPKFDSANNRYGTRPKRSRANQACNSGPVVDSTKYGNPIDTVSNPRMRKVGFSAPSGFQSRLGAIGISSKLMTSKLPCTRLWREGVRYRTTQCE